MNPGLHPHFILLHAGTAVHHGDWNWQQVCSPFARLYYVKKGSAFILTRTDRTEIRAGGLYFIPPFQRHGYSCDDELELCYFHIYEHPAITQRILEEYRFPREAEPMETDVPNVFRLLELNRGIELPAYDPSRYDTPDILLESVKKNRRRPLPVNMETSGILNQLVARFLCRAREKDESVDDRIRTVISHIRRHIDQPVSVEKLARLAFLSKDHFIRLFKRETGQTPAQYILRKKIEKSQLLLVTTDLPVKAISRELSFANSSYFTRMFRRFAGVSPARYRKSG